MNETTKPQTVILTNGAGETHKLTAVSFCFDTHGNRIDRYEDGRKVHLIATRSAKSPKDEHEILEWYWRYVGVYR